jgi:excisionase family DNA binding protein
MQAYASAQSAPVSESGFTSIRAAGQVGPVAIAAAATAQTAAGTRSSLLASLILDGLDDHGLAVLAQRLLPHLQKGQPRPNRGRTAYTVASLAAELGVSQKAIRCAIERHELSAVKRGARWIISAEAVHTWATAPEPRRKTSRTCTAAAPKTAGPSLRSVLCGQTRLGGAR